MHTPSGSIAKRAALPGAAAACIVCIGLVACLAILWATARFGVGVSADSTVYVGAARSLLASGELDDVNSSGNRVPLVHYPPLLPALLAGISRVVDTDPVSAARWMGALLFGLSTMLAGLGTWRVLKSPALAIAAALTTAVFTPMVAIHQMALSEPLYVLLSFVVFLALIDYLDSGRTGALLIAAVAAALAVATRYAGVALIATGVLAILFHNRSARGRVSAILYALVAGLPLAGWLVRNRLIAGTTSDFFGGTTLDLHSAAKTILAGLDSASAWLLPGTVPPLVRVACFALLALWLAAYWRRLRIPESLAGLSLLYTVSYLAVVLATILFLDGTTPLDDRILLPLFAPLLLLSIAALPAVSVRPLRMFCVPVAAGLGLLLLTNVARSAVYLRNSAASGRGYSAAEWRSSSIIRQLKSIPQEVPVYGTLPSSIRFLTNLPARQLPNIYNPRNRRRNPDYSREISALADASKSTGIVVVYFRGNRDWYPEAAELATSCDLQLISKDDTGSLYMSSNLRKLVSLAQGTYSQRTY